MKKQFAVWRYQFPVKGEHPCVLISRDEHAAKRDIVNVLFCTSQRQNRPPKETEVMLNGADGLDWETFCECSTLWTVQSKDLFGYRGVVSPQRRNAIRQKIRNIFRLLATD